MTKEQKNEVIEVLKEKFSQYSNFYVTNTESLTVVQGLGAAIILVGVYFSARK